MILKKLLPLLFAIILVGCQTNEFDKTKLSEEQPEVTVKINNEEVKTNTRIYCWNVCEDGGDMEINIPELTKGLEIEEVTRGTKVNINVNSSIEPTTIGYFQQHEGTFKQKSVEDKMFEIYGQEGIQHYLVVADWYDENNNLIGRATTPFVIKINEKGF